MHIGQNGTVFAPHCLHRFRRLWAISAGDLSETEFTKCAAIIAIPVRNEQEHIEACLKALGSQTGRIRYGLVLLLNNCTDETPSIVKFVTAGLSIPISVTRLDLPPTMANSGHARRIVMEKASALARPEAVLMTTDADARVPSNWIEANLAVLSTGVDVVAGRAEIDPTDAAKIPKALHEDDARECHYGRLIDEIHSLLDPDPADPWPRHIEHSGASLAVTLKAYQSAGGIPPISPGEDRAFVEALKRTDARIRHAPEISVTVSGRIFGRAIGGMADTIRRRLVRPDSFLDEQLEPACDAVTRARLRRFLRAAWECPNSAVLRVLAKKISLDEADVRQILAVRYFGEAWAELEGRSSIMFRKRVLVSDLDSETAIASLTLHALRKQVPAKMRSGHRAGNVVLDAGGLA